MRRASTIIIQIFRTIYTFYTSYTKRLSYIFEWILICLEVRFINSIEGAPIQTNTQILKQYNKNYITKIGLINNYYYYFRGLLSPHFHVWCWNTQKNMWKKDKSWIKESKLTQWEEFTSWLDTFKTLFYKI